MPGGAEAGLRRAIKGEERSGIMKRLFDAVFRPHYYAGARAEEIFEQQAEAARWIMERISQEKKTIMKYKGVARSSVKRGDFICRNCCNAEIEVKCKTKYSSRNEGIYYLLEYSHIKRHGRMKEEITNTPVVFAFYERKGRSVLKDTLRMIDLDFLLGTPDYKKGDLYDKRIKCIKIPFRYTREGFQVLDILSRRYRRKRPR